MRPFRPTPEPSGIYFGTLADLIDSLEEAYVEGRLKRRRKTRFESALVVVDEIGCLSVVPNGAKQFSRLVNARYGRVSTVLTSNKTFGPWREIPHDEVIAAALLDRLLHRCHIVYKTDIVSDSYYLSYMR